MISIIIQFFYQKDLRSISQKKYEYSLWEENFISKYLHRHRTIFTLGLKKLLKLEFISQLENNYKLNSDLDFCNLLTINSSYFFNYFMCSIILFFGIFLIKEKQINQLTPINDEDKTKFLNFQESCILLMIFLAMTLNFYIKSIFIFFNRKLKIGIGKVKSIKNKLQIVYENNRENNNLLTYKGETKKLIKYQQ